MYKTDKKDISNFLTRIQPKIAGSDYSLGNEQQFPRTIEFNKAEINNANYGIEDPTWVTFNIYFDADSSMSSGIGTNKYDLQTPIGCLLFPEEDQNSAINYLYRINRADKANQLKRFRNELLSLCYNKPWYFQSVSGLSQLMSTSLDNSDFKSHEMEIEVKCLETFDQRMNYIFRLYQTATMDWYYLRDLLPHNLKTFNCRIIITELRNLKEVVLKVKELKNNIPTTSEEAQQTYAEYIQSLRDKPNSWINQAEEGVERAVFNKDTSSKNLFAAADQIGLASKGEDTSDEYSYEKTLKDISKYFTTTTIFLGNCVFDLKKSFDSFNQLSVGAEALSAAPLSFQFSIRPGNCNIYTNTQFGFLNSVVENSEGNIWGDVNSVPGNSNVDTLKAYSWTQYDKQISEEFSIKINEEIEKEAKQTQEELKNMSEITQDTSLFSKYTDTIKSVVKQQAQTRLHNYSNQLKKDVNDYKNEVVGSVINSVADVVGQKTTNILFTGFKQELDKELINKLSKDYQKEFTNVTVDSKNKLNEYLSKFSTSVTERIVPQIKEKFSMKEIESNKIDLSEFDAQLDELVKETLDSNFKMENKIEKITPDILKKFSTNKIEKDSATFQKTFS